MPRRPVEAGDRVFGVAGESLRAGGHVVGVGSPKNEILRSEQKVSYLDHLGVQRARVGSTQYFTVYGSRKRKRSNGRGAGLIQHMAKEEAA